MTYQTYEFTAYTDADLLGGGGTSAGSTFTVPGSASVCFSVSDNDAYMSGDSKCNEQADDKYGQQASIEGANGQEVGNGGQVYAEVYHWVKDSGGNWYLLIEIEQEGTSGDYFAFHNAYGTPPAGETLTFHSSCNIKDGGWQPDYKCLEGGEKPAADLGTVSGRYFNDEDCDGLEDANEAGFEGKEVKLRDADTGQIVATTTTDADGNYTFENVEAGNYCVVFERMDGFSPTARDVGNNDAIDSDLKSNWESHIFTVDAGENEANIDAGVKAQPGWIKGRFTHDADGNDNEFNDDTNAWDAGIEGAEIQLLDLNGAVVATTTTDAYGNYMFDVAPGEYRVKFPAQTDKEFSAQNSGVAEHFDSDADANGLTEVITVTAGGTVKNIDAGVKDTANDAPEFNNLPADGILCVDENETSVLDINANDDSDSEGNGLSYEIVGGRDAAFFEIDPNTGELSFKEAQDFENPQSGGNSNTYDVTVKVTDSDGASETKALWVKVKDVDETTGGGGECIVIEAEDMQSWGFRTVHGDQASGGELVKLGYKSSGDLQTTFNGEGGTYDLKLYAQDECDGQSVIMIKVNGQVVKTITLDNDNDGRGSNNGGFSEFTVEDLNLQTGDTVGIWAQAKGGEYVRIDKIELCQDGEVCPEGFGKEDFSGQGRGTIVNDQFDGFTVTAQRDGDGANSPNDAMIFDSANPTGGDHDLGFANLGNIIIISEDGDSNDPDDNAGGGTITFTFDNPSDLHDIKLLDIEENGGTIDLFAADGSLIKTVAIPAAGNNSIQTIKLDATDVASMEINLVGSGAVDDLCFKPGEAPALGALEGRYFCDENGNNVDDGEVGIEGATVWLLDDTGAVVRSTTTGANGEYSFEDLEAGNYSVRFEDPNDIGQDGKVFVDANQGGDDTIDSDVESVGGAGNGNTGAVTVVAGETTSNVDAGIKDPATAVIEGRVFCDENDNDVNDGGDAAVAGVVVELLDGNGDPVLDGNGDPITATTAADGSYEFTGLEAGDYQVRFPTSVDGKVLVDANDPNGNGDDTNDSDADTGTGTTGTISVGIGETSSNNDAGVEDPAGAEIKGRYFCDENDNDVDDGEPGIANAEVILLDAAGNEAGRTTTDGNGNYAFTGLSAGTYSVVFAADADGKTFVAQDDPDGNGDDTNDSDVDATGTTGPITVGINEVSENNDAGVEDPGTASLGDTVFLDENGNGVRDNGEEGVEGVTVTLTGAGADGVIGTADDTTATDVTDADGDYGFDGLDAGDYKVTFDASNTGLAFTTEGADADDATNDDSDADQATGMTDVITLDIGEAEDDIDAGLVDPAGAEIRGRYFCDENDNDVDDGEPGIANATVTLLDANGNPVLDGAGNAVTTTTGPNGNYAFTGLAAGTYGVLFAADAEGKTFVAQDDPDGNGDDTNDSDADANGEITGITVGINEVSEDNDAGVEDPNTAAIEGRVFCDSDDDSLDNNNGDEDGVGGVTVTLLNADGSPTGMTATTNPDGSYSFTGLAAGDYIVDFPTSVDGKVLVDEGAANDGSESDADTTTGETDVISVGIGETSSDNDAGVEVVDTGDASIAGRVFCDENDDSLDNGEAGVGGVEVALFKADGTFVTVVETNPDGSYIFTGLEAGDYFVDFDEADADLEGKVLVTQDVDGNANDEDDSDADEGTGTTDTITVGIGEAVEDVDAGVEDPGTASVGDTVFIDTNGNGVKDIGENGLNGVEVKLLADLDGDGEVDDVVDTTTTVLDGQYQFNGLDAGEYAIMFTNPNGYNFTTASTDPADATNNDSDAGADGMTDTFVLSIGEDERDIDAGLVLANGAPTPMDDELKTCADEEAGVPVLFNDSDPENDPLTIVSIDGQAVGPFGGSVTTSEGTIVTLQPFGGLVTVNGEAAYAGLDIGEEAVEEITYTVSDPSGNTATATLTVTFCGDANSVDALENSLPTGTIEYKIRESDLEAPVEDYAFDLGIVDAGDSRFDGVLFEDAYCLSYNENVGSAEEFADAGINTGGIYDQDEWLADGNLGFGAQTSIFNGQAAADNLDLINYILNEEFEDQGFSQWEVQRAIWALTDDDDLAFLDGVDAGFGTQANVDAILADAALNGEGFEAGVGDNFTFIVDPGDSNAANTQPFIVSADWEEVDCLCIDGDAIPGNDF